jgi:hypothetical protein
LILVLYKLHLLDESNVSFGAASEKKTLTNLPIEPVASSNHSTKIQHLSLINEANLNRQAPQHV